MLPTADRPSASSINRNRLLAALPSEEYERITATLDTLPLPLKQYLHRAGEPIDHVYFPGGGFCSMVTALADGDMIEIATIGREGFVGASAMLKGHPVTTAVIVKARRIPVIACRWPPFAGKSGVAGGSPMW